MLDESSFRDTARWVGTQEGTKEAGGILQDRVSLSCDYFVTDRTEAADVALAAGAKRIIDTLTLAVLLMSSVDRESQ